MEVMSGYVSNDSFSQDPLIVHAPPSWNLYGNPCYNRCYSQRKVARSFWDLSGCKASMDSELGRARAQIVELKSELEMERKARKKAESGCRKLVKQVCKERKGREELSRECDKLVKEVELTRSEMERMRVVFEDERRMMKMVEGLREEQVQMKLTEAKLLYEEEYNKLLHSPASADKHDSPENSVTSAMGMKVSPPSSGYKCNSNIAIFASAEFRNPHVKQGIKGFVEFPKVVKAMGSKKQVTVYSAGEPESSNMYSVEAEKPHEIYY